MSETKSDYRLERDTLMKILENSYDEISVIGKNGDFIYTNRACERHYGLKRCEMIGRTVDDLNNLGYWYPLVHPRVCEEKRRITIEQNTISGKKLVTTATPVFDSKGEIELVINNTRDITQLEGIKRELEVTREILERNVNKQNADKIEIKTCDIIAHNIEMREIIKLAERIAVVDSKVLILGESGTGKGVLARHIHKMSRRSRGPFMVLNCAAIPEDLLESELFGYAPGAFTGASKEGKKGLIELANDGTLFLDEISEISPRLQAKLLQAIQDRQFIPVGGGEIKTARVRILAASNGNLTQMVTEGKFRQDLFYRLNVIEIEIPPLRKRLEDIVPLAYFFLNHFNRKYELSHEFAEESLDILMHYSWPGNVRELENIIERSVVIAGEDFVINSNHLPRALTESAKSKAIDITGIETNFTLDEAKEELEKNLVIAVYNKLGSSRKVANALNISQSRASRLINKYVTIDG